jgi:cyclic pyranopterin phosphate synthase
VFTCLFATRGHDLRAAVRGGATRTALASEIAALWRVRGDRYSQLRAASTPGVGDVDGDGDRVEMSYIGG